MPEVRKKRRRRRKRRRRGEKEREREIALSFTTEIIPIILRFGLFIVSWISWMVWVRSFYVLNFL